MLKEGTVAILNDGTIKLMIHTGAQKWGTCFPQQGGQSQFPGGMESVCMVVIGFACPNGRKLPATKMDFSYLRERAYKCWVFP